MRDAIAPTPTNPSINENPDKANDDTSHKNHSKVGRARKRDHDNEVDKIVGDDDGDDDDGGGGGDGGVEEDGKTPDVKEAKEEEVDSDLGDTDDEIDFGKHRTRSPPKKLTKKKKRSWDEMDEESRAHLARSLRSTGSAVHEGFNMDLPYGKALSTASQAIAKSEEDAAAAAIKLVEEQEREEEERHQHEQQSVNVNGKKKRGRPPKIKLEASGAADDGEGDVSSPPSPQQPPAAGGASSGGGITNSGGKKSLVYGEDDTPNSLGFIQGKSYEPKPIVYIRPPQVKREVFDWNFG